MVNSSEERSYTEGWEALSKLDISCRAPDVGMLSQQAGLSGRLAQIVGRGILVSIPATLVAAAFVELFALTRFFPGTGAVLGSLSAGFLNVFLATLLVRFWWDFINPEFKTTARVLAGFLGLLFLSFWVLGIQAGVSYHIAFLYSGIEGKIDRSLLFVDSLTVGLMAISYWEVALLMALAGLWGVSLTNHLLDRWAPWQVRETVAGWVKAILLIVILAFLGVLGKVMSDLNSEVLQEPSQRSALAEARHRFQRFRPLYQAAWDPVRNYRGVHQPALAYLAKRENLGNEEAQARVRELVAGGQSQQLLPLDVFVASWWIDEKLGFDHRTASHDLEFEKEIVPANLALWQRSSELLGADSLWEVRHTGTLFALENLIESPGTDARTLELLRSRLSALELTASDLRRQLMLEVLNSSGGTENYLFGGVRMPDSALNDSLVKRSTVVILGQTPESPEPDILSAFDKGLEELGTLKSVDRELSKLTLQFVPTFSEDELETMVGLPARLRLCRVGVEMRMAKLQKGSYPDTVAQLPGTDGVSWDPGDRTLRVEGAFRKWSLMLP